MNDELETKIESIVITGDVARVIVDIAGIYNGIKFYELKSRLLDMIKNEVADKWMLENAAKLMDEIDSKQILNSVILQLGKRMVGEK